MSDIIDRRLNGKDKNAGNRERFLKRYKNQIKKSVANIANGKSIKDLTTGSDVSVPTKDIDEPYIGTGSGGTWDRVIPGNTDYKRGDTAARPRQGSAPAGHDGDPFEEEFAFTLSRDEFLKYFFEDLALPNLVEKKLGEIPETKNKKAGYTTSGSSSNMHLLRSMRGALGRRIATGNKYRKEIARLEELIAEEPENHDELLQQILWQRKKLATVPWIDPIDIRYRNTVAIPEPSIKAVMVCIMDVSGSMGETEKTIAKKFFTLLYLFLTKVYGDVEVVFIRHHTEAKEVTEDEFFNSRESGGTKVSSALTLAHEIISSRFATDSHNTYIAQVSDGDNAYTDNGTCLELVRDKLMPLVQYMAYIEITTTGTQGLWTAYKEVGRREKNLQMETVEDESMIYPVFKKLFKKLDNV